MTKFLNDLIHLRVGMFFVDMVRHDCIVWPQVWLFVKSMNIMVILIAIQLLITIIWSLVTMP